MSSSQWRDAVVFYKCFVGFFASNRRRHDTACPPANGVTPSSSASSFGILHIQSEEALHDMSSTQWCDAAIFYKLFVGFFTSNRRRHDTTCFFANGVTSLSSTSSLLYLSHPKAEAWHKRTRPPANGVTPSPSRVAFTLYVQRAEA